MARVTVEDCIVKVPNRFELVIWSAQRTRQISAGATLTIDRDNDKNPVIALREIAEGHIDPENLKETAVSSFRRYMETEPQEQEFAEIFAQETTPYSQVQTKGLIDTTLEGEDTLEDAGENLSPEEK